METTVYTANDTQSQEIEQKMREKDTLYEKRLREEYVEAAWKRWLDAVQKNKAAQPTLQQPQKHQ